MNARASTYPALRQRVVVQRRARALFLPANAQHLERTSLVREIGRAAMSVAAATAWCAAVALLVA